MKDLCELIEGAIPQTVDGKEIKTKPPLKGQNVEPGYATAVNIEQSENYYRLGFGVGFNTKQNFYGIGAEAGVIKGQGLYFNTSKVKGDVTIGAKYIGHPSVETSLQENLKKMMDENAPAVDKVYVEAANKEKSSYIKTLLVCAMIFMEIQLGRGEDITKKWKEEKNEFLENWIEEQKQYYIEHPNVGTHFDRVLFGVQVDETNLNVAAKTDLAISSFFAGVVKDIASGINGVIDMILSPSETLGILISSDVLKILWEGLTGDISNDLKKGTIQGNSEALGRVGSMLIPASALKSGKAGKVTKVTRGVSGKTGIGVEISQAVKEINIKEIRIKNPVKYGEHYNIVNRKKTLKPDIQYVDPNNYKYTTDAQGRISRVEGELKLQKGERNPYAQRQAGGQDRLPTDDGGHLIGSQFGGSGEIDNLVPQSSTINRANGEWYKMEQEWSSALKEGKTVEVDIQPIYGSSSARPDSFSVSYKVDGVESIRNIPNSP